MNKSQRFIVDCIKAGRCPSDYVADEFQNNSVCYKPFDVICDLKDKVVNNSLTVTLEGDTPEGVHGSLKITVTYNPNEGFQYFTSDKYVHDGTLLFLQDAITTIFNRILSLGTHYAYGVPEDFDGNVWEYDYEYIIGDFVINNQVDEKFAPSNKPYCTDRQIVCLPIKLKWIKHKK